MIQDLKIIEIMSVANEERCLIFICEKKPLFSLKHVTVEAKLAMW